MLKLWVLSGVLCCTIVMVIGTGDIGPGLWHVIYIAKCEEEFHKFKFDVKQKKINRTHDGFDAKLILKEDFTDKFGVRVDICKDMDGGCKPYQVLSDNSFINFANKYAKNNVQSCLEYAGIDPPEFPIKAGEYKVNNFVFNYDELPSDGVYGSFTAKAYTMLDTEEVSCVMVNLEFREIEDEDEEKK